MVTGSVTWTPGHQTFAELRRIRGALQTVAAALKWSLVSDEGLEPQLISYWEYILHQLSGHGVAAAYSFGRRSPCRSSSQALSSVHCVSRQLPLV